MPKVQARSVGGITTFKERLMSRSSRQKLNSMDLYLACALAHWALILVVLLFLCRYAAGGAQLKHTKPAAADAAPGKGIVPWMAGAQKAAAIAAEKKVHIFFLE